MRSPGGLLLGQIGEFSFVLQRSGAQAGLTPLGLGAGGEQILVAVTVVLMIATPALGAAGSLLGRSFGSLGRGSQRTVSPEPDGAESPLEGPVLISGWGAVAAQLAAELHARGVRVSVTTLSPDLAAEAENRVDTVVRGDPIKQHVLAEAELHTARMVVICENDSAETAGIASVVRQLAPNVPVVARPTDGADVPVLSPAGVDGIVDTTRAVMSRLGALVLHRLGIAESSGARPDPASVVEFTARPDAVCPHVADTEPVLPTSAGCTECLRLGEYEWVHLRICLHCGQVGCCDSSPHRHASGHAASHGHPVVVSAEPNEDWAWCYLDRTELEPRGAAGGR